MKTARQVSGDYAAIETYLRTGNLDSALHVLQDLAAGLTLSSSAACKLFAIYGYFIREIDEGNINYVLKHLRILKYNWLRAVAVYDGEHD